MEDWFNRFIHEAGKLPGQLIGLPDPDDVAAREKMETSIYRYQVEWNNAIKRGYTEAELNAAGFKTPEMYIPIQISGVGGGGGGIPIPFMPMPRIRTSGTSIHESKR